MLNKAWPLALVAALTLGMAGCNAADEGGGGGGTEEEGVYRTDPGINAPDTGMMEPLDTTLDPPLRGTRQPGANGSANQQDDLSAPFQGSPVGKPSAYGPVE